MQAPVVGQRLELAQLAEGSHPAVADGRGDRASERRVRQPQPAARCDAVGLVVETLGEHLGQVLDGRGAQQLGVNGRHAVGAVRADNGQVGHADLALRTLLDEADVLDTAGVAGETLPHRLEQAAVDLQDDLEVTRQQQLEPRQRPFLQGFGQQRVVRIRQRPLGEVPGLVPAQMRFVEQDAQQLGHRQCRVRIIELDGDFLRQHAPVGVTAPETPHQIGQRAGDKKILLHKAQSLAHAGGVVGVQDARHGFGRERLGQGADKIAAAEFLKIEVIGRRCSPESQRIDGLAAIAHHGAIKRDPEQGGRPARDGAQGVAVHLERAVHPHCHLLVRPHHLPRVRATQPVVRLFVLPAVLDGLAEDAVFVPQPVAYGRELHRRHRIQEARCQAPKPAIPQAGVGFLREDLEPIEVLLLDNLLHEGIEQQVGDIIGQRAANEKLHREIVDAFGVVALICFLRLHPALRQDIPHGVRHRLKTLTGAGHRQLDDVVEDEMAFIERIVRAREPNRATAVLAEELRHSVGFL